MRTTLLLGFMGSAVFGCAGTWHPSVAGTVSYTTTPPEDTGASSASPLRAAVCVARSDDAARNATIQLGDRCVLRGPWEVAGKPHGGKARLAAQGECLLPRGGSLASLRVDLATLNVLGDAVDLTVGGTSPDARYVTYRFTGSTDGEASTDVCAAAGGGEIASTDGTSLIAPGRAAWESSAAEPLGATLTEDRTHMPLPMWNFAR